MRIEVSIGRNDLTSLALAAGFLLVVLFLLQVCLLLLADLCRLVVVDHELEELLLLFKPVSSLGLLLILVCRLLRLPLGLKAKTEAEPLSHLLSSPHLQLPWLQAMSLQFASFLSLVTQPWECL